MYERSESWQEALILVEKEKHGNMVSLLFCGQ
jgi:hypothetical protein